MNDEFSALDSNALKEALGEEVEEEPEAQDEEKEAENEPELSVGNSEFASLNEEALLEAKEDDVDLEEVDTFIDDVLESNEINTSIDSLEKLIETLKEEGVKEALSGMKMTINISFSEES